jgi:DNA-damage-inducible protein J
MAASTFMLVKVDTKLKNEAEVIVSKMGLTVSDVVRLTLSKIVESKGHISAMNIADTTTAKIKLAAGEHKEVKDLFDLLGI